MLCGCLSSRAWAEEGRRAQNTGGGAEKKWHRDVSAAHGGSFVVPICVDISRPHSLFSCVPTCICKGEKAGSCPRCLGSRGRVRTAQSFPGWTGALVNSPSPINIVPAAGGPQTGTEYQALSHPAGQEGRRFCTEARLGTRKGRPHFWSGAPRLRLLLTVWLSTRSGSRSILGLAFSLPEGPARSRWHSGLGALRRWRPCRSGSLLSEERS